MNRGWRTASDYPTDKDFRPGRVVLMVFKFDERNDGKTNVQVVESRFDFEWERDIEDEDRQVYRWRSIKRPGAR